MVKMINFAIDYPFLTVQLKQTLNMKHFLCIFLIFSFFTSIFSQEEKEKYTYEIKKVLIKLP